MANLQPEAARDLQLINKAGYLKRIKKRHSEFSFRSPS